MQDYLISIRDIGFDPSEFTWNTITIGNSTNSRLIHNPTGFIVKSSGKSPIKTRDNCLREMEAELKELLK